MKVRLGVYGLGKLGLPLAASFAAGGVETFGIDIDAAHVAALRDGHIPFDEPGLADLVRRAAPHLSYHVSPDGLGLSVSLIQVPTPSNPDDPAFSARYVVSAVRSVCQDIERRADRPRHHLVIVASTVMPGTIESQVKPLLAASQAATGCRFDLAYVPDLVAIGDVVRGFRQPPSLVIGFDDEVAGTATAKLYDLIVAPEVPRALLSIAEAEITKVAWNFYFCFKISFANTLLRLSQHTDGVDVDRITETLSADARIGAGFLKAGMPFGGPCFPRDVDAMAALLAMSGQDPAIAEAVNLSNESHYEYVLRAVLDENPGSVGVLGLAFKAGTDVTIRSPSIELIVRLIDRGVAVHAWDPAERARRAMSSEPLAAGAKIASSLEDLVAHSDVVVLAVNDPAFARVAGLATSTTRIVDPWGLLPADTEGVISPGRGRGPNRRLQGEFFLP